MTQISMELEELAERARRVREIDLRIDDRGATRPAREPWKRKVLERMNGLGTYAEGDAARLSQRSSVK